MEDFLSAKLTAGQPIFMEVLSANGAGSYVSYRLDQLLPHTFKLRS